MLGPMIASLGSTLLGHTLAKDRQDSAQDFSAQQFATRFQTTVKDMEAAGLNPALAYQQGGGSPPSSTAAGASNFDMSSAQMALIKAQARKVNAEAEVVEETAMTKAHADIDVALQQAGLSAAQIQKVNQETDNLVAELDNIKETNTKIKRMAQMLNQQAQLMSAQSTTEAQRYNFVKAQVQEVVERTGLLKNQAALAQLDVLAAKSADNIGREFGQYGPMIKTIIDIVRTLKR